MFFKIIILPQLKKPCSASFFILNYYSCLHGLKWKGPLMKVLVVYYSKSGNNAYLAQKIAKSIKADIEKITPVINAFPVVMLLSMLKAGTGIRKIRKDITQYDKVIVCGPIWAGFLCSALLDFIKKYKPVIKQMYFATSCGSDETQKDSKFGYERVFKQVKDAAGEKCVHCEAFPVTYVLPEDKRKDEGAALKIKLSDENFSRELIDRLKRFVSIVEEK
jgi:flavodoxin